MANENNYTKKAVKEAVKIDKDNIDLETSASICTMIQETLHKEAVKFTEVIEQLSKTYKQEFIMGEFGVCLAVSDGVHPEPIVQMVVGSIPGTLKNLKALSGGLREVMHD
ncbi:MAG: hypothetical protein IKQ22_00855 [Clostridia bacterium]|nr:hypothetical protein [Clostridia bacterium]